MDIILQELLELSKVNKILFNRYDVIYRYKTYKEEELFESIYDILRRGFFDIIIHNQSYDNDKIIIDLDFKHAEKILKFVSYYADSTNFAVDIMHSRKFFLENEKEFETNFDIDGCLQKINKQIIFRNKKSDLSKKTVNKFIVNKLNETVF